MRLQLIQGSAADVNVDEVSPAAGTAEDPEQAHRAMVAEMSPRARVLHALANLHPAEAAKLLRELGGGLDGEQIELTVPLPRPLRAAGWDRLRGQVRWAVGDLTVADAADLLRDVARCLARGGGHDSADDVSRWLADLGPFDPEGWPTPLQVVTRGSAS
jgi:hypothetical protein